MHGLDVIIIRNAQAAGREAAIAENDGKDRLATSIINNRPGQGEDVENMSAVEFDVACAANRAFWAANSDALSTAQEQK